MQKQLRNIAAIYITAVTHTRTIVVACVLHMHLATPISLKIEPKTRDEKKLYANAAQQQHMPSERGRCSGSATMTTSLIRECRQAANTFHTHTHTDALHSVSNGAGLIALRLS